MNRQDDQLQENYDALLLGYAAGILDMAQNFIVSAHLALSPQARALVRQCEAIGGALMENECAPVAMREASLNAVLSKLDAPPLPEAQAKKVKLPQDVNIPEHLLECLSCRPCAPRWRRFYPGLEMCELPLECRESGVRFIKGKRGAELPHHAHRGQEITLVLDGAYMDETGVYRRGDMVVLDETIDHATKACDRNGIVAVVVSSEPIRLTGLLSLLNPFLRF